MKIIKNSFVLIAVLFGVVTIFAGSRALLGVDPGYIVYRPLLIYNATMGIVYISAGIIAYQSTRKGWYAAGLIFALNLLVLLTICYLYKKGSPIAIESLRAMTLRTVVWLVLFIGFGWLNNRKKS